MINPHAVELTSLLLLPPLLLGFAAAERRLAPARRVFSRLASRRWLAAISVGVAAVALRAALLPIHPPPEPAKMDEYSYLLSADTLASGRLANPAHPFWIHFETNGVLSQPAYVSKYPPAQGIALAAGLLLFHSAWAGVCLSIALMCAAIVWMLQGWVPPRWALLGGIVVLLRIAAGSYWIDSYWGGAAAAIGGALLYGALPRLMRRPAVGHGLALGAGLAILANSRPYEGLVLALPALIVLAVWAIRRSPFPWRALVPMLAVLGITAAAMVASNRAATGSPWVMPYQVHEAQYAVAPLFWFQQLRPEPVYHHPVMRALWTGGAREFYQWNFRVGLLAASLTKLNRLWTFFLGPLLTVPLLALPWLARRRDLRLVFIVLAVFAAGLLLEIDAVPHYAAPATALIYLVVVQCLRQFAALHGKLRLLAPAVAAALASVLVLCYSLETGGYTFLHEHYSWCFVKPGNLERARILKHLEALPGKHLVMVRYGPEHEPFEEWVYNRASIDDAKVVWAREMDPASNGALQRYFASRRIWLLEPDRPNPAPEPYPNRPPS